MPQRIHHINFIVRDLERAARAWERVLGRPADSRDQLPDRGVDIVRFRLGETWLVLVQPVRDGTLPARHLAEHGEGFFLMALDVEDLDTEVLRLGESSFVGPARIGLDDWRVRDLESEQLGTALIQLAQDRRA